MRLYGPGLVDAGDPDSILQAVQLLDDSFSALLLTHLERAIESLAADHHLRLPVQAALDAGWARAAVHSIARAARSVDAWA